MKDHYTMKPHIMSSSLRKLACAAIIISGSLVASAQPAPGIPGNSLPNPGAFSNPGFRPGPSPMSPPQPPSAWGSPWWNGWNPSPTVVNSPSVNIGNLNNGRMKVIACGYDAMGVWRVLPLYVSYRYNGINYNVNVINAWDPWTDMWNRGVDVQAFSTNYVLKGVTYDYYVVLSFGTFYFNL